VQIKSPVAWIGVHALPLLAFPFVIHVGVRTITADLMGVSLFLLLWVILVVGQTATVRGVKGWAVQTALGLFVAWMAGMLLLPLLDARMHLSELPAVGITHAASGAALGAVQGMSIRGRQRSIWIAASAAAWGLGAALAFWLYSSPWLPGLSGAFPGRIELTTIVRMLPVYALVMLAVMPIAVRSRPSGEGRPVIDISRL
jgi:hypothetical protein